MGLKDRLPYTNIYFRGFTNGQEKEFNELKTAYLPSL